MLLLGFYNKSALNNIVKIFLTVVLFFDFVYLSGQSFRDYDKDTPYTANSWLISYGSLYLYDTYLSNMPYTGWNTVLEASHMGVFKTFDKIPLYWKNMNCFNVGYTVNLPFSADMIYLSGETGFGVGYLWLNKPKIDLSLGIFSSFLLGEKLNRRNINNIYSIDGTFNNYIDFTANYKLNFSKVSLSFMDNLQLATLGAMFVPDYGELYYEYNFRKVLKDVRFYSPHNNIGFRNRLEMHLAFYKVILKIQYQINYKKWNANNLYFKHKQHNIGLGIILYLSNQTKK